ncbi:MAG: ACR3 family arsenite efflux transporter [Firmicutes bacterium]|nr:ACR3 family arsenite efflux transporter [Bacillota bacterium]
MSGPVKKLNIFEQYLTIWAGLCIILGVLFGKIAPGIVQMISKWEVSGVNLVIAVLIWLMIFPMMLGIDFASILEVRKKPSGILITLFVNWVVKPFSMAFFAWLFFRFIFAGFIPPEMAQQYIAGCIILAAAPCTAMVFVWSYLVDGDPAYTLVQVALNDLIMLVLFAPIVMFLLGVTNIVVPLNVLLLSVFLYIVIPLSLGYVFRKYLLRTRGPIWFESQLLVALKPVTIVALLVTLVIIFAFQGEVITQNYFNILLIAVPILIQVYFNSSLAYGLSRWLRVPFNIAAASALIGASNFFELAVAVAISLFGIQSGATLAVVVGVLVEVPVMLSVVNIANRTRHWFDFEG